ncbi:hypothetical protein BB560_007076 [Smittium megazygosporum]|uniref:Uncharacterized protein n=1 Tax=Smittium megazygosporum TaxID=133381 RepID=A0A2T9XYX1_9FUNG|nr:hypothetical protein BB560_007076 [Smittium megazygosporum]
MIGSSTSFVLPIVYAGGLSLNTKGGYGQHPPPQGQGYGQHPPPQGQGQGYGQQPPRQQSQPQFEWKPASNNSIPPNAVQGGVEADGRPIFVARAFYKGGLHPGKAGQHLEGGGFAFGYGGKEVRLDEYQVLCGNASQLRWVERQGSLVFDDIRPVEAGHEESGEPLFIAKTLYDGGQQLGKAGPHLKSGMSFSYGKKEKNSDKYMVLCYV